MVLMEAIWYVNIGSLGKGDFEENKESDQSSSPFRRWTTGSGAGSSYRHAEHRNLFQKQMSEGSGGEANSSAAGSGARGPQWAHGGVARWSLGLDHLLADPVGRAAFADFLAREFAHENIIFWCSCEEYSQQQEAGARAQLAKRIWERHLADTAPDPVNVDASARRNTLARLNEHPAPIDLFHQAQRQIFHVMRMDSYQRFLRSGEHAECARADLRGLPPPQPYAHAAQTKTHSRSSTATPPPDHSASSSISNVTGSAPSTPSKLKKSASNASERRRSGGASLLPWRLRVPSRERAAAAPMAPVPPTGIPAEGAHGQLALQSHANVSDPGGRTTSYHRDSTGQASDIGPPHAATAAAAAAAPATHVCCSDAAAGCSSATERISDVFKSGALCRVVLPDGATSVVHVEDGVPVRRLVDRLLQRRNLVAFSSYDVLHRATPEGPAGVIDANAPSSVLGGLEVVVERRCIAKFELCGRVVAVRCRPARRLRHVLKPVLSRYAAAATAAGAAPQPPVLRDGLLVHPDTLMHELDGARLFVVVEAEVGGVAGAQPPDPAGLGPGALCDLALRLAEESNADGSPFEEYASGEYRDAHNACVYAARTGALHAPHGLHAPQGAHALPALRPDVPRAPAAPAAAPAPGAPAAPLGPAPPALPAPPAPAPRAQPATAAAAALPGVPGLAALGRVRAALKPGPSVHSHPPCLIEKHETKEEGSATATASGSGSASGRGRVPPPLPPKPPARTPTLV